MGPVGGGCPPLVILGDLRDSDLPIAISGGKITNGSVILHPIDNRSGRRDYIRRRIKGLGLIGFGVDDCNL
jgi:hypothetical protein